jgi:hypothetical protein
VDGPHNRRIRHAETEALCEALMGAGAWQTAMRVRIADAEAASRHPGESGFEYRPTVEDAVALDEALEVLRTQAPHSDRPA